MSDREGNVLIQVGVTTDAEQNEVNDLLSRRQFNREWRPRNRGFRNRTTRTDSRRRALNYGKATTVKARMFGAPLTTVVVAAKTKTIGLSSLLVKAALTTSA